MPRSASLLPLLLLGCDAVPADPCAVDIGAQPDRVARLRALEDAIYGGCFDLTGLDATCAALGDPEVQAACLRALGRPHLFRGAARQARDESEPEVEGCGAACDEAPSRLDCTLAWALEAPDGPGCACLVEPLARDECWFRLSEELRRGGGLERAPASTAACLEAGKLKGPCLHHQAEFLGARCASLDEAGLPGWREHAAAARALEDAVSHWSSFERDRLGEVVWAGAIRCALQAPSGFPGGLPPLLPPIGRQHLRAALAWHLVAGRRGAPADLQAWSAELEGWERTGVQPPGLEGGEEIPAGPREDWVHDAAAWCLGQPAGGPARCGGWPALRYFGLGKRLVAEDEALDRRIVLLEAVARLHPGAEPVLEQASTEQPEPVRSAARSLLALIRGESVSQPPVQAPGGVPPEAPGR
jgi:hypothetical protein